MHIVEFITSGLGGEIKLDVDPETEEIVACCPFCEAKGRQHPSRDTQFTLKHHALCPMALNMSRAQRHALATGHDGPAPIEPDPTEVLHIKSAAWSVVLGLLERGIELETDLAEVALQLIREGGGASLTPRMREALEAFLIRHIAAEPDERRALEQLCECVTPAPLD